MRIFEPYFLILFMWQFFFRLFADCEKDPPQLDYTEMLLYFACHPDPVEGVYRALSVAVGTHIFQPIGTPNLTAEEVIAFQKWTNIWVWRGMPEDPKFPQRRFCSFYLYIFRVPDTMLYIYEVFNKVLLNWIRNWGPTVPLKNAFIVRPKICSKFQSLLCKGQPFFCMKYWSW